MTEHWNTDMTMIYKCRMCGAETESFVSSKSTMFRVMADLVLEPKSQQAGGCPRRYDIHFCDGYEGGRIGFADLIGARTKEWEDKEE